MCWDGDDPDTERRAGVAGDGSHQHAQGVRRPGSGGAGDAEARSALWHLFVFRGRRGDLIKVIWNDGQGMCLFAKGLERGRFLWPSVADGRVAITAAQFGYLLEGIDWRMPQKGWRPLAAG